MRKIRNDDGWSQDALRNTLPRRSEASRPCVSISNRHFADRFDLTAVSPPPISDVSFWLSLHTAFISASSDVLKIPPRDLAGTYRAQDGGGRRGEIVVYDRVPGGAGYVQRIQQQLGEVLQATLQRVQACPNPLCDPDASCYACLKSYQNQIYWDQLKRSVVTAWLEPARRDESDSVALNLGGPQVLTKVSDVKPVRTLLRRSTNCGMLGPLRVHCGALVALRPAT
jgi:hypothetical protein